MSKYLIDSSCFINAHRVHYPFDVVDSFWAELLKLAGSRDIYSISKVDKELAKGQGLLQKWAATKLPASFFRDESVAAIEYGKIMHWLHHVKRTHYKSDAIARFIAADSADPWLVAYAMKTNYTVVTQEVSAPQSKSKVKMPDVCIEFNVKYINIIDMFRELSIKF